jgi:hypothetical protein
MGRGPVIIYRPRPRVPICFIMHCSTFSLCFPIILRVYSLESLRNTMDSRKPSGVTLLTSDAPQGSDVILHLLFSVTATSQIPPTSAPSRVIHLETDHSFYLLLSLTLHLAPHFLSKDFRH